MRMRETERTRKKRRRRTGSFLRKRERDTQIHWKRRGRKRREEGCVCGVRGACMRTCI